MTTGDSHRRRALIAATLTVTLLTVTPAAAGIKSFSGNLRVNQAPVSFDVEKRGGRYRHIPVLNIGDKTAGIPVECEDGATERAIAYGELKVARDGTVDEGDGFARIKGEFVAREVFEGTVKIKGEGQGIFCTSNGPLKFRAKLVP